MTTDKVKKIAKVAEVKTPFLVVLNIGDLDGVKYGDDFILYRLDGEILDPDTGEALGSYEEVLGVGTVTHVQERICTLESSELKPSGVKVIKKYRQPANNAISMFAGFMTPVEEITEEDADREKRPFSSPRIGDLAKRSSS